MAQGAGRVDRAGRFVDAPAERVWRAWTDPAELMHWLPPAGMTGQMLAFDPRPGGAFRMVLTYLDAEGAPGKTDAGSDRVEGRFVVVEPSRRLGLELEFVADDPRLAGTMRMDWTFAAEAGGTRVAVAAWDVPEGITAGDHEAGMARSLEQLARWVASGPPGV